MCIYMRVSHSHNFIMLSPQKSASNSIFVALAEHVDIVHVAETDAIGKLEDNPLYQHVTLPKLKQYMLDNNYDWDQYFKFCFVRNPWDRYVSWYSFMQKHLGDYVVKGPIARVIGGHIPYKELSFKDFICRLGMQMHETIIEQNNHYQYPMDYYYMDEGNVIDYVGKVETIDTDFNNICDILNIEPKTLGIVNTTEHAHYRSYYDSETIDIVAEMESDCVDRFNYTF